MPELQTSRRIDIARPVVGEAELQQLREPLASGWLTQGPKVSEFEVLFAARHGVAHAVATSSCTTALHLLMAALEIGPGDEVIVPAFTWVATANVVCYVGATPVFADVSPITYNVDPAAVRAAITARTRAIIPVHLFGLCADMDELRAIAGGIPLIEDAACAVGAEYHDQCAGTLGLAGAFSFHPRKIITTGEGGMITCADDSLAERLRCLRNHGAAVSEEQRHLGPKPYLLPAFAHLGYNFRMTDLQGAVGCAQMARLEGLLAERRRWAAWYAAELEGLQWLRPPVVADGCSHSWQAYVCAVDPGTAPLSRNHLMDYLQKAGISTRPGTHSVAGLDYYRQRYGVCERDFPGATFCEQQSLAIPLHSCMSEDDFHYVVETLYRV